MKDTTIIWIFGASPLFLHVQLQQNQMLREDLLLLFLLPFNW